MASPLRKNRVETEVRHIISDCLLSEIKDPRLQLVCINDVKINNDLSSLKAFFSRLDTIDGKPANSTNKKAISDSELEILLNSTRGVFHAAIGRKTKFRIIPKIRFIYDQLPQEADKIEALIARANADD